MCNGDLKMDKKGKESMENVVIPIVKIGMIVFVGYLLIKALRGV